MIRYLKVKIINIEGGAGYKGIRYDQTVVVELPVGGVMGLFESTLGKKVATTDMIGSMKEILIIVPVAKVEVIEKTEPRIEPYLEKPSSSSGHIYFGAVNKIGLEDIWHDQPKYKNLMLVNVGLCDIIVPLDPILIKLIKPGDFIKVYGTRSDLLDIN